MYESQLPACDTLLAFCTIYICQHTIIGNFCGEIASKRVDVVEWTNKRISGLSNKFQVNIDGQITFDEDEYQEILQSTQALKRSMDEAMQ